MPITRDEGNALAELIGVVRPQWNTRGIITKGLAPLMSHPAPLEVIAWAAIRAAKDRENLTPAVIPLNGPHWNLSDRPPEPRLTPEHECPRHPGKWAGNCSLCRVDGIDAYHDQEGDTETDSHLGPKERARAAAARAKRALALPPEDDDETEEAPHVHKYLPLEDGLLYGKPRYRNTCACGHRQNPDGVTSTGHPVLNPTEGDTP